MRKKSIYFENLDAGKVYNFGSNTAKLLLERNQTNRNELMEILWKPNCKGAMVAHPDKEQSFFILEGKGEVTIAGETKPVKPGDLVYVPRNTPHTTSTGNSELRYLCLNSMIDDMKDAGFEEMYNRISQDRIERWENNSIDVGE